MKTANKRKGNRNHGPDGRFKTSGTRTTKPIRVSLPMIEMDVYWDNQMVANIRVADHRMIHCRDEELIRQIIDDKGLTLKTKKALEL